MGHVVWLVEKHPARAFIMVAVAVAVAVAVGVGVVEKALHFRIKKRTLTSVIKPSPVSTHW